MSKEKRRVPKLRFPGFTEDWEQRKLSDILVERNEQQVETNEYPLMSFVQGHGVIPKGERYDRSFLVLDQSKKYKRTELGDFIYSSNNLETGSIGINKTGKAVISPVYSIFYGVSIGDSQFIGIMSLLPRFITKMIRFRQGVVYGQWRIHEKDFLDISILIPSEAERTKITKLILSIEELITLHQRKLNNLKLKKKALLQKLFPKNGKRYPELRFPGFTDAWEQRKLTYIFNDFIVPMRDKPKVFSGTTPWTRIEDIEGRYINTSLSGQFVSDETIKSMNLKVIPKGSLIVSASATFGVVAIVNNDLITNQTFIGLVPNKDFDIDFLYSLFEAPTTKNKLLKLSAGSTIFYIARESFENLVLSVPSKEEQIKISKVFKSIDDSITLHQQEPFLCGNSVNGGVKLC